MSRSRLLEPVCSETSWLIKHTQKKNAVIIANFTHAEQFFCQAGTIPNPNAELTHRRLKQSNRDSFIKWESGRWQWIGKGQTVRETIVQLRAGSQKGDG